MSRFYNIFVLHAKPTMLASIPKTFPMFSKTVLQIDKVLGGIEHSNCPLLLGLCYVSVHTLSISKSRLLTIDT